VAPRVHVLHQESRIDLLNQQVIRVGGQGVEFHYSYDRYMHEVKEVLTDCKAFQFFQLYDIYGQGFASKISRVGNDKDRAKTQRDSSLPSHHP